MSPSSITRSLHLVMGVGAVGARADDGEVDLRMAVVAEEAGEVGGDLALAPAREPHLRDLLETCVGGRAGSGKSLSSSGPIALNIGSALVIDTYDDSGTTCCRASTCIAQAESEIAYRPCGSSSSAVAAYGSLPSFQSASDKAAAPGAASASGRSRIGTIIERSPEACRASRVIRSVIAIGW